MTEGALPPTKPTFTYQLGLWLAAVTMVLLPVVYVALTAATAYGVYYFATHYFPYLWRFSIGFSIYAALLKIFLCFTPLLAGVGMVFALIKPLFAPRRSSTHPLALIPAVEPRVLALVQQVCASVGAPSPERVEVDCALNAGAGFDRNLRAFLQGRLVLTLGLPLVAGLTQRELAGVIAHEFGHFRQGVGMRLCYVVRRVNHWFARVVYERDGWDEALEAHAASEYQWWTLAIQLVRLSVGTARLVLKLLMYFGHALCCVLLRQMEYAADRAQVHIAGTAALESTLGKLAILEKVWREVRREMQRSFRNYLQLPDNLPVLLGHRLTLLSPRQRQRAIAEQAEEKTGWLDTHPSTRDRIRQAQALNLPGLAFPDAPAQELFENFATLSRLATIAHYEDDLNLPTGLDHLLPIEQLIRPPENTSAPSAPAAPPQPPIPMMSYDPSAFQKPRPTGAEPPAKE